MNLKRLKNHISLLLVVSLFFSALAAGFHHHSDNTPHDDCPICIASAHTPTISSGTVNLTVSTRIAFLEAFEKSLYLPISQRDLFGIRAPPL